MIPAILGVLDAEPAGALAASAAQAPTSTIDALDTLWVLVAAVLVFFMQAGFGMVETGLVRSKNAANVLFKNALDFSFATLGYFSLGYAIMWGGTGALFGTEGWFLAGVSGPPESLPGLTVPFEVFWLFQVVFAGAAATIVAGAVAERMRFSAYLMYSFVLSAVIYPVVGHWAWGGGWLGALGFHDFAGSTVVHAVGGVSALVGAWLLGPRLGRFNKDGSPNAIVGHSLPLVTFGVFVLWFGWYGFNAGSTLGMADPSAVGRIAVNTTLAPATSAVTAMTFAWLRFGRPDLTIALNGALGGLVAITAPCLCVSPGAAIFIGGAAGLLVVLAVGLLDRLRIDDPVGAFPVHGACGIFGTLAVAIFGRADLGAPADGLFYGGGVGQLGTQTLGLVACLAFTAVGMWVVFKAIDAMVGLRVSRETELRGLDHDEHGHDAYAGFQIFTTE